MEENIINERCCDTEEKLLPSARFQVTHGYKYQESDGEIIIYDLLSDRIFQLNGTGKYIWEKLSKEASLLEVSDQFSKDFQVEWKESLEICSAFAKEIFYHRLLSKYPDNQ